MPQESAPADPGWDEDPARRAAGMPPGPDQPLPLGDPGGPYWEPVITRPDPMTEEEREAWLDALAGEDEPFDPEEYPDPDGPPPPGEDELTPQEVAEIGEVAEAEEQAAANAARSGTTGALAAIAARAGRRGPGQPGSARIFPGESASRAAAFGSRLALDVMPGCPDLAMLADAAAGPDDTYDGASDDELVGVLCAWDRLEAHMAARKLAAAAELIRRRPEPGCPPEGPARMPAACEEFTTENCDHRFAAKGHDPGIKLRHLAQVRHATCTSPICRRPAATCDFEHNIPYEAGGRSCLCNGGPKCRHDHRLKQHPRWHVDQLPDSTFRWTTPSGRQYTTEPTRYPI